MYTILCLTQLLIFTIISISKTLVLWRWCSKTLLCSLSSAFPPWVVNTVQEETAMHIAHHMWGPCESQMRVTYSSHKCITAKWTPLSRTAPVWNCTFYVLIITYMWSLEIVHMCSHFQAAPCLLANLPKEMDKPDELRAGHTQVRSLSSVQVLSYGIDHSLKKFILKFFAS